MTQEDALMYLKKHKDKWHTSADIAKGLNISSNSIHNCMARLRKSGFIRFKKVEMGTNCIGTFFYKHQVTNKGDF
jgi:biotin operon repressor